MTIAIEVTMNIDIITLEKKVVGYILNNSLDLRIT